ncbi:MAG: sugar ABC transporter permease [Anaerolineaceae bacterium]|nr:sugar ABC transporter permease [Anaerolineaceae bacterium]
MAVKTENLNPPGGFAGWLRRMRPTRQEKVAFLFILPLMVPMIIYWIIPSLQSLYYSLTNYSVVMETKWVGLANFTRMWEDKLFWRALWNSVYFTVANIPLVVIIGLVLAMAVNAPIRARNFFRVVFYLPLVTSTIALSMVWLWLFDPTFGLLNALLHLFRLPPQLWLQSTAQAMPSIVLMSVWGGVGGTMLIYLAGLQGIPESLYEAAKVDGASSIQVFWLITLPLLAPVTLYVLVTSIIGSFQIFGPIYAMTNGGPAFATTTFVHQIYVNGFRYFNMGYASAQSWVLFVLLLGLSIVNLRLMTGGMEA